MIAIPLSMDSTPTQVYACKKQQVLVKNLPSQCLSEVLDVYDLQHHFSASADSSGIFASTQVRPCLVRLRFDGYWQKGRTRMDPATGAKR